MILARTPSQAKMSMTAVGVGLRSVTVFLPTSLVVVMLPLFPRGETHQNTGQADAVDKECGHRRRGEAFAVCTRKTPKLQTIMWRTECFSVSAESVGDCSCWFGNFSSRSIFLTVHVGGWKTAKERQTPDKICEKPQKASNNQIIWLLPRRFVRLLKLFW